MSIRECKPGEPLRDMTTGRVGIFTGEVKTSHPARYCVAWEDGTVGSILERNVRLVAGVSREEHRRRTAAEGVGHLLSKPEGESHE